MKLNNKYDFPSKEEIRMKQLENVVPKCLEMIKKDIQNTIELGFVYTVIDFSHQDNFDDEASLIVDEIVLQNLQSILQSKGFDVSYDCDNITMKIGW